MLLKLHGAVDRHSPDGDSFVVTEDHYIDYLAQTDIANLVPVSLMAHMNEAISSFSATAWATGTCASSCIASGGSSPSTSRVVAGLSRSRPPSSRSCCGAAGTSRSSTSTCSTTPRRWARCSPRRSARRARVTTATVIERELALPSSPYVGLVPFSESDSAFFFGRDEWRDVVADNLKAYRLTVLYGESGAGKTSLLRAGVVYKLQEEARRSREEEAAPGPCVVYFSSWLGDPLAELVGAVRAAVTEAFGEEDPAGARRADLGAALEEAADGSAAGSS